MRGESIRAERGRLGAHHVGVPRGAQCWANLFASNGPVRKTLGYASASKSAGDSAHASGFAASSRSRG